MKIKDKKLKVLVDVADAECPKCECYWPRPDPGVFSQGVGYTTRFNAKGKIDWLCGRREINGCPSAGTCLNCHVSFSPGRSTCYRCGQELKAGGKKGAIQE
jgi:hypothetical protein